MCRPHASLSLSDSTHTHTHTHTHSKASYLSLTLSLTLSLSRSLSRSRSRSRSRRVLLSDNPYVELANSIHLMLGAEATSRVESLLGTIFGEPPKVSILRPHTLVAYSLIH